MFILLIGFLTLPLSTASGMWWSLSCPCHPCVLSPCSPWLFPSCWLLSPWQGVVQQCQPFIPSLPCPCLLGKLSALILGLGGFLSSSLPAACAAPTLGEGTDTLSPFCSCFCSSASLQIPLGLFLASGMKRREKCPTIA